MLNRYITSHRITLKLLLLFSLLTVNGCNGSGDRTAVSSGGHTLRGSLQVPAHIDSDSDVNDKDAPFSSNNDLSQAQAINNPTILGGYLNKAGSGAPGRSQRLGDSVDNFVVDLRQGQAIVLFVGSSNINANDLDLLLLNSQGQVVDVSANRGQTESLIVPQNGRYYIQVKVFSGATNYVLSLGQSLASLSITERHPRLSDDFVAGEITAVLKPKSGLNSQALHSFASRIGLTQIAGEVDRRLLFNVENNHPLTLASQDNLDFIDTEQAQKYATLIAVKRLEAQAQISAADPNYRFYAQQVPNDGLYKFQWHYPLINLPQAWDITTGNSNVIVAVIDTGVLLRHPDLGGQLIAGYDFIRDINISMDGNGIDNNPDDPGDAPNIGTGSSFHGTHVAGVIAARTGDGQSNSVAGIAWNTKIMPLRVLGRLGSGTDYDIEQAIRYAAGLSNDSRTLPRQRADIINLSLGGPTISSSFQAVVDAVRQSGVMIVAAAGNDGNRTINYPGALRGVISVAAVDMKRNHADYSNFNQTVDISAPGGSSGDINGDGISDGIVSTMGDDSQGTIRFTFAPLLGTSMATPHMAGVLALMKAANPDLNPNTVDNLISSGLISTDLGESGRDDLYGYGLINAYQAVLQAAVAGNNASTQISPAQLVVSPRALNFGLSATTVQITLSNAGEGSLQITAVTQNSPNSSLGLVKTAVNAAGLGVYTATLDRSTLSTGTYSARFQFKTNANTVDVPVIWQVGNTKTTGTAGHQFVLLVNPDTLESVAEAQVNVSNGQYQYTLTDVPTGEYLLMSGSDHNNDLFICDSAESCGAYPLLSRPSQIFINQDFDNLNFGVSFNTQFRANSVNNTTSSDSGFKRLVSRQIAQ